MKTSIFVIACVFLVASCSSTPKNDVKFAGFSLGEDKESYCKQRLVSGGVIEDCLHQLTIHERSSNACSTSFDIRRCMRLNRNLWEGEVMKRRSALDSLAFHTGKKVDPLSLHQMLLFASRNFTLMCPVEGASAIPCADQALEE